MKKLLILVLSLIIILGNVFCTYADTSFSDVDKEKWYYDNVTNLVNKGAIEGYADGSFKPNKAITTAEFVKITTLLLEDQEEISKYNDEVNASHWASNYIAYGVSIGIIPQNMFSSDDWDMPISREKMSTIMELVAEKIYKEESTSDSELLSLIKASIKDFSSIGLNYQSYVVQAVSRGLITGYTDGSFKPYKSATRAEAATLIMRLIDKTNREAFSLSKITTSLDKYITQTRGFDKYVLKACADSTVYYINNANLYSMSNLFPSSVDGGFTIDMKEVSSNIYAISNGTVISTNGNNPWPCDGSMTMYVFINSTFSNYPEAGTYTTIADIQKVDYFVIEDDYNFSEPTVVVVPNPLKQY